MTGAASAGVDPLAVVSALAESASALRAALEAVPGGGHRRRAHREERLQAYLAFQQAAHEASVWPMWLGVLEQAGRSNTVNSGQVLPELAACRDATAALLTALGRIRLVGNPEPRRRAEEIVTLLIELMEARLPGVPARSLRFSAVRWLYRKIDPDPGLKLIEEKAPWLADFIADGKALIDPNVRRAQAERFDECQRALGAWHKKFILAARKDLGDGPRKWHIEKKPRTSRLQFWRSPEEWPGGWPPRAAGQLIEQARQERQGRSQPNQAIAAISPGPVMLAGGDLGPTVNPDPGS